MLSEWPQKEYQKKHSNISHREDATQEDREWDSEAGQVNRPKSGKKEEDLKIIKFM